MLRTTGEWAGTCVSMPTVSVLQQPPEASSCLSSLQTDHRHLPQPILLLRGMLSRNMGLKKVKFACSCSVLSVPLSISGIKCLLLGVRFCGCLAPSCQYSPSALITLLSQIGSTFISVSYPTGWCQQPI